MAITVSDGLKAAAVNPLGSTPVGKVEVYPVSGHTSESKGLNRTIFDMTDRYANSDIPDRATLYDELADKVIWPLGDLVDYCPLVAFNWGDAPPLGISPSQLSDGATWGMKLDGYFHLKRPEGYTGNVTYTFGYVATGFAGIAIGRRMVDAQILGSSPHGIREQDFNISVAEDLWVPISIFYARRDDDGTTRQRKEERFVAFWKDSVDDEWRVIGADVTCPVGGKYTNIVNTPITAFYAPKRSLDRIYKLTIHQSDSTYYFHWDNDNTEFVVNPGTKQDYKLHSGQEDDIEITWSGSIADGDKAEIQLVRGKEVPYELPALRNISIDHSENAASVLRFSVPVTVAAFDEDAVDETNAYTYDLSTDSFGVLRVGRHIRAYLGYKVDGVPEYVRRFTGIIQDRRVSHMAAGDGATTIALDVTCLDARSLMLNPPIKKIEDIPFGPLPNDLSYDIAQVFPDTDNDQFPDGGIRPSAYDRWNIVDVVRTVAYQNGFNSSQLWAKDDNGNFLIDDRGVYVDATRVYPFSFISPLGADHTVVDIPEDDRTFGDGSYVPKYEYLYYGSHPYRRIRRIERITAIWTENAGAVVDTPYLYSFEFDSDPCMKLVELCQSYGLDLDTNVDGNVYLRYPNNPMLYSSEAGADDTNFLAYYRRVNDWERVEDGKAIGGVRYTTNKGNARAVIHFRGVGIKLVLPRPQSTDSYIKLALDDPDDSGMIIDGINVLDDDTGDTGHFDWTDYVSGSTNVLLTLGRDYANEELWYYSDGIYPELGVNPTVITICDNLTYGDHLLYIWNDPPGKIGRLHIEGFMVLDKSVEYPQHEFDAATNLTGVEGDDSLSVVVNDVVVVGNQSGAARDYVSSRIVDLASIGVEGSANYIGRRMSWLISDPKIINQERADYLANHIIQRYKRGRRTPALDSVGLPWLENGDPVTISDTKETSDGSLPVVGYYSPGDLSPSQRNGSLYGTNIDGVPFQRYWITDIREEWMQQGDVSVYKTSIDVTSLEPLPAYEPSPEPDQDEYDYPIMNQNVTIDGGTFSYNPYLSDAEGKYINFEFDMTWHARYLRVDVIVIEDIITVTDADDLYVGMSVNTLLFKEGFVLAGKYELSWDGWVDLGNGQGHYAPNGDYAFQISTNRYSTGTGFSCRTDTGYPGVVSGSKSSVSVWRNRELVYDADPFEVETTPLGTQTTPGIVYDSTTNGGRGIQFDITLAAPAKVVIPIHVYHHLTPTLPGDIGGYFNDILVKQWVVNWRENEPLLEPGSYTFYFRPATMLIKEGRVQPFIGPIEIMDETLAIDDWYVSWLLYLAQGILITDKAGVTEIVHPSPYYAYWAWGGYAAGDYAATKQTDATAGHWFFKVKDAV